MTPAIYNFEVEQGARYRRVFTFPNTIDLTGAVARMQITQSPGGKIIQDSNAPKTGDVFTINSGARTLTVELAPATTAAFKFDAAKHDIDINGDRFIKGKVLLAKET